MEILPTSIRNVITAAVIYGWYTITVALVMMLMAMASHASARQPRDGVYLAVAWMTLWEIIPGVAFLVLANRMRTMSMWSFYVTIGLCAVVFLNMVFNLIVSLAGGGLGNVSGCAKSIAWQFPAILLAAMVMNAMPEVRSLRRARARRQVQRGFEPIMPNSERGNPNP